MKKFWNILVVAIFINFMALPSIATIFDFDIPQAAISMSEEETHSCTCTILEKTIPRTLNVHDFIKFFETRSSKKAFLLADEQIGISPYKSITSPPPEA